MTNLLDRLKTSLSGRYDVEREIGKGGMAIVFLARDMKHDRPVAIKVLQPELSAHLGGERFLREIQTAARLDHPHILPLFDSGEADGLLYYVMPYVEGESLAERIRREGQLPLDEALGIAREVADALDYAHGLSIVHRDIKPGNIMLSGGHARVTDFGISKALSAAGADQLTATGVAMGTLAYMAPEQAAGRQVDGRADIYSLACTLFEVLVGHVPFTGSPQAVMARHTLEPAPSLRIVRPTIPDAVDTVVRRALEKSPADRYKDAGAFGVALRQAQAGIVAEAAGGSAVGHYLRRWWKPLAATSALVALALWAVYALPESGSTMEGARLDANRVAVTYFEDASSDGRYSPLADALTEDLIARLAPLRGLDVMSPGAVSQFRGLEASRDSIARALEVGTIVEGLVEELGSDLRVTVRLVDGASGAEFDRQALAMPASDALAIRDSVALQVEQFLRERLGEEIRLREGRDATSNPVAWSDYASGERLRKDAEEQVLTEEVDAALSLFAHADSAFARAAALDEAWAEPLIARAAVAERMAWFTSAEHDTFDEHVVRGMRLVDGALQRDPGNPEALAQRGSLKQLRWSFSDLPPEEEESLLQSAEDDLVSALNMDNSIARAHFIRGLIQGSRGEIPAANLSFRQAWDADAYLREAPDILNFLVLSSMDLEYFSDGARFCDTARRRYPSDYRFISCGLRFMITDGVEPDIDTAWELLAELEQHSPPTYREFRVRDWTMMVAGVIARAGFPDSARAVLARARATPEIDPERELLLSEAYVQVLLGDHDAAFDALTAYMAANPGHRFVEGEPVHWRWRPLTGDPRFQTLVVPATGH